MDRPELLSQIKEQTFASKLLTSREKWALLRELKKDEYQVEELQNILNVLLGEDSLLHPKSAQEQYIEDLEKWHDDMNHILHVVIPQKIREIEKPDHLKDEAEADKIINEIQE